MSKYTTQIRFICETYAGYEESMACGDIEGILEDSWQKVFDFDFPIFNEEYRKELCIKILRYFYTREIGFETVGLWKSKLNSFMVTQMPYFNKLYAAWALDFSPIEDTNLSRFHTLEKKEDALGNSLATSNRDSVNRNLFSETPQGALTGVENENYLTNATKDIGNEKSDSNASFEQNTLSNDEFNEILKGKSSGKSYSEMLGEYHQNLINIDQMVFDSLEPLFMQIW